MAGDDDQALSRRQLFTEALPRGVTGLFHGVLRARQEVEEWAAAGTAPLYRLSYPSPELMEAFRNLHEIEERTHRESPELDAATPAPTPAELPDYSDPESVTRYLDELEARARSESEQRAAAWRARAGTTDGKSSA